MKDSAVHLTRRQKGGQWPQREQWQGGSWPAATTQESATVGWEAGRRPQPTVQQWDGEAGQRPQPRVQLQIAGQRPRPRRVQHWDGEAGQRPQPRRVQHWDGEAGQRPQPREQLQDREAGQRP